jgi:hypothetical protein
MPLLLVFGGLFAAADAAFAGILGRLFGWDLREIAWHLIVAGCWAWIVAGYLRRLLIAGERHGTVGGARSIGWLALVFLWFLLTVLRGRRERFAFGALVAAFAVVGLLDGLNPDDLIVRVNAARPATPRPFDSRYAASLSADAVPALVEALPTLPESERGMVSARILQRWSPPEQPDWRTWNWGRARAWQAATTIEADSAGPVVER